MPVSFFSRTLKVRALISANFSTIFLLFLQVHRILQNTANQAGFKGTSCTATPSLSVTEALWQM